MLIFSILSDLSFRWQNVARQISAESRCRNTGNSHIKRVINFPQRDMVLYHELTC
jgi:hypothetical protein